MDDQWALTAPKQTPRKMENLHSEGGAYGSHRMAVRGQAGIRFVEIACPPHKVPAVARFYKEMLGCDVWETTAENNNAPIALVSVGPGVHLVFVETTTTAVKDGYYQEEASAMKGVHICFYANDFQGLYHRLSSKHLIWTNPRFVHLDTCDTWEEAWASRTLRFKDVIDLSTGEIILELEHETRPLRHGQFLKVPMYEPR